jgi:putative PIG3 family NAD(P)H quinone oxidoreductase
VHAVTIDRPGGAEVLTWREVPDAEPGPGEVLIDVEASAVNRADLLQRAGFYPPPPGASPYPGLECSGVVSGLGAGVTEWNVGDQVCALLSGGGYAQQVAVPAGQCLPVPAGVSLVDAAGLPEVACTVWSNVFMDAHLSPLETFLVHGGGSGIGTFAIQLASEHGARVLATARPSKHAVLHELGADVAIDYLSEDFVVAVHTATGGHGADVILDVMGASYLERNVSALATGGRLCIIGMQGGRKAELDISALMAKRAVISSTSLRARPTAEKATIVAAVREHVWPLIEAGRVKPVIFKRKPMPDVAAAHRVMESSDHIGKILLLAP